MATRQKEEEETKLIHFLYSPANFQNPKAGGRRTNLHAMISDFKPSGQTAEGGVHTLTSTAAGPVAYVGPAPPAENPPYPHRYVSLLYETPAGFAIRLSDRWAFEPERLLDLARVQVREDDDRHDHGA